MTIWIGEIQWMLNHGFAYRRNPVLSALESIRTVDALLDLSDPTNPREAEWPARHRDSLLPLFLMLDSPGKNLGAENVDDKLIGSEIYRRFRIMQDVNPEDFQLIVADNDLPFSASEFAMVQLDYEHPLMPWVRHPGPDLVTSIE